MARVVPDASVEADAAASQSNEEDCDCPPPLNTDTTAPSLDSACTRSTAQRNTQSISLIAWRSTDYLHSMSCCTAAVAAEHI